MGSEMCIRDRHKNHRPVYGVWIMDYTILCPRKNPRLQNYDYRRENYYFVTVCAHHKQCVFGAAGKPNVVGQMAAQGIKDISRHFPGVDVDEYVVMPNHVHMILVFPQEQCNLSAVVGSYKSYVSKMFHVEHCADRGTAGPAGCLCADPGGLQPEGQSDRHYRPRGH